MARKPNTERKTVEIDRKRIPLRSLMHGKEIRDAAKALEDFRLKLKEQEFLYGAKLYIDWKEYQTVDVVARRLETDKEFEDRLERTRIAEEQKRKREEERKKREAEQARQRELRKRADALETIRKLAREQGISDKELVDSLKEVQ